MRFTLTIDCDNAAFEGGEHALRSEVREILMSLVESNVAWTDDSGPLRDHNGNTVGRWSFEEGEDR